MSNEVQDSSYYAKNVTKDVLVSRAEVKPDGLDQLELTAERLHESASDLEKVIDVLLIRLGLPPIYDTEKTVGAQTAEPAPNHRIHGAIMRMQGAGNRFDNATSNLHMIKDRIA